MKVFISADIEGTAGITDWTEALKEGADYAEFRRLMTDELIAACEGARAAGAEAVVVKDAHQTGRNLIVGDLPDYVQVFRGWSGHPHAMMSGLKAGFDAALYRCGHLDTTPQTYLDSQRTKFIFREELLHCSMFSR